MPDDAFRTGRFEIKVNDQTLSTNDPKVRGRDILELAGLEPVDEYVLLKRMDNGDLEDINLADEENIRQPGVERYIAFRTDRVFYFKVDDRRYPWGAATIGEADLRETAGVPEDKAIWLERRGGAPDEQIEAGATARLDDEGLERFYTADRPAGPVLVTVFLDNEAKQIRSGDYTTETLKAALGVGEHLDLDFVDASNALVQLQPGQHFVVVAGQKFISHERQGGSS